ncbi:MAG: Ig-like domain-containing protein [Longimicrobiaceae bacterium]
MRPTVMGRLAVLAGFALSAVSCGDDARGIVQPGGPRREAVAAARIIVVSGNHQLGFTGRALASPLVVRVFTAGGTPAVGAVVTWTVLGGGGSTSPASMAADEGGYARTVWTLGPARGDNLLQAASGGATASLDAAAADPREVYALAKVSGDTQTAALGKPLPRRLVVRAQRADGSPVGGVPVAWSTPSGGTVAAVQPQTAADGTAEAEWRLGPLPGAQSATVVVGAASAAWSATATGDTAGTIRISPISLSLKVGDVTRLVVNSYTATGTFRGQRAAAWSSSSPGVARVDSLGTVTAVAPGTATLTARADGRSDAIPVSVAPYERPRVLRVTPNRTPIVAQRPGYGTTSFTIEFSRPVSSMSMTVRGPLGTTLTCAGTGIGGYNTPLFACQPRLALGVEPGVWRVVSIAAVEHLHAPFTLGYEELRRSGTTGLEFEVRSTRDVTAPVVTAAYTQAPDFLTDPRPPRTQPVLLHVTDAESGVVSVSLMARSPTGRQTARCEMAGIPFGGNPNDGNWFCWLPLPAGAERGFWTVGPVTATDLVRNASVTRPEEIQRVMGYPVTFRVN